MKFFATLLIFTLIFSVNAQEKDTIFYNKYWSKTKKNEAFFYRPLPLKKEGNLFVIKDYYINGQLQMKAYSKSNKKDIFEGKATWYSKNGRISSERNYINNTLHGQEKSYFRDGTLLSEGIYKSGKMFNGTFFISNLQRVKTYTVENGNVVASNIYYQDNKKVAKKNILEGTTNLVKSIYYNKNGKKITEIEQYVRNKDPKNIPFRVILQVNENKNVEKILFLQYIFNENDTKIELLKDANGRLIGKGIYKNNRRHEGIFYKNKALQTYKEGLLNGETILYDENHQEKSRGIYKNGLEFSGEFASIYADKVDVLENGKLIAVKTKNDYTKEKYLCTYKNDKPFNGSIMSSAYLKDYKDGQLLKETEYEYRKGRKKTITFYEKKAKDYYEKVTKKIFYKDGETYTLNYKNGKPNNGILKESYGYVTYKDGKYNGPYLIESLMYSEEGSYKNGKKTGVITTKNNNKTYEATFKDNEPFEGVYFDGIRLTQYKNGKKNGCGYSIYNNRNIHHDSVTKCYKNDQLNGKITYYKKGKVTTTAIYENDKPLEGTVYDLYNSTTYKNGEKIAEFIKEPYKYYTKNRYYKNGKVSKEIMKDYFTKDTITSIVTFKNGFPYNGKYTAIDKNSLIYTSSNYKNGKKEGEEIIYIENIFKFIAKYHYFKGKKQGKAQFRLKDEKTIYNADYKNDKPYNGITIIKSSYFIEKNKYKEGKILKTEYFLTSKYDKNKLTEISYKGNEPYDGTKLIFDKAKKNKIARIYKDGKLTETILLFYNFKNVNNSKYQPRIYHSSNKDSLVNGKYNGSKTSLKINYTNKKKTSGNVLFLQRDTMVGKASFTNNKLTALTLKQQDKSIDRTTNLTVLLIGNDIQFTISEGDVIGKYTVKTIPVIQNIPLYFYNLTKNNGPSSDVTLTLVPENISSIITVKNNKPYDGLIFRSSGDKTTYNTKLYKNGEQVSREHNLTRQELINKIKNLKK